MFTHWGLTWRATTIMASLTVKRRNNVAASTWKDLTCLRTAVGQNTLLRVSLLFLCRFYLYSAGWESNMENVTCCCRWSWGIRGLLICHQCVNVAYDLSVTWGAEYHVNAEEAESVERGRSACSNKSENQSSRTTEARGEIIHFTEIIGEEGDTTAHKASEDANPAASDSSRHATTECRLIHCDRDMLACLWGKTSAAACSFSLSSPFFTPTPFSS